MLPVRFYRRNTEPGRDFPSVSLDYASDLSLRCSRVNPRGRVGDRVCVWLVFHCFGHDKIIFCAKNLSICNALIVGAAENPPGHVLLGRHCRLTRWSKVGDLAKSSFFVPSLPCLRISNVLFVERLIPGRSYRMCAENAGGRYSRVT
jgi:hypothetical protein